MPVKFSVRDKYSRIWGPVTKKGTRFHAGEGFVELFRVNVFALAIGRSVEVVKDYTKQGRLPKPLFVPEGNQCKHWYSAEQVVNSHRLMRGKWEGKQLKGDELTLFFSDLRSIWYRRDVCVTERGEITK